MNMSLIIILKHTHLPQIIPYSKVAPTTLLRATTTNAMPAWRIEVIDDDNDDDDAALEDELAEGEESEAEVPFSAKALAWKASNVFALVSTALMLNTIPDSQWEIGLV